MSGGSNGLFLEHHRSTLKNMKKQREQTANIKLKPLAASANKSDKEKEQNHAKHITRGYGAAD